jgi:hypothetical protein
MDSSTPVISQDQPTSFMDFTQGLPPIPQADAENRSQLFLALFDSRSNYNQLLPQLDGAFHAVHIFLSDEHPSEQLIKQFNDALLVIATAAHLSYCYQTLCQSIHKDGEQPLLLLTSFLPDCIPFMSAGLKAKLAEYLSTIPPTKYYYLLSLEDKLKQQSVSLQKQQAQQEESLQLQLKAGVVSALVALMPQDLPYRASLAQAKLRLIMKKEDENPKRLGLLRDSSYSTSASEGAALEPQTGEQKQLCG